MKRPDFFIVGASKCGTTAMYDYLKQHPDIFMSPEKEPMYFCPDLVSHRRSEEEYLKLFFGAGQEKRVGEASSAYLYSKHAAREIKNFSPTARIIIMLRNPVEMLHARHAQLYYHCIEDIEDFSEALNAEQDRKDGRRPAKGGHSVEHLFYRETAKYAEQIRRYQEIFPADRIKIIVFDDFKSDPARVYRETCHFLDVNAEFKPEFVIANANKRIRSRFLQELLEIPGPRLRKLGRPLTPRSLRHKVMNQLRHLNSTTKPRGPLDPILRRALQEELAPEVMQLSELLNRDLSHWLT
jgi:hypothetical protein